MTAIQYYAERRVDPAKSCYSMDQNKVIIETSCHQQLPYVCVMVVGDEAEESSPGKEVSLDLTIILLCYKLAE